MGGKGAGLSSAVLSSTLSCKTCGMGLDLRCGEGGCAAMLAAPPPYAGLGGLPVRGEGKGRLHTAHLGSRLRQHICLLLPSSLEATDSSLDSRLLWVAFFKVALTCCWLTRVP